MSEGRSYASWISQEVKSHLRGLLDAAETKSVSQYREAMHALGRDLGSKMLPRLPSNLITLVVCTVEDADFLARGLLEQIESERSVRVFCYWNDRNSDSNQAPIIRRYEEPFKPHEIGAVIVVKSIISTACVVRTNLIEALDQLRDDIPLFVVAPVLYKDAQKSLKREFPEPTFSRFQFLFCAVDSEKEGDLIRPGIGGSVYELLGLGDKHEKNRIRPELVAKRTARFASL